MPSGWQSQWVSKIRNLCYNIFYLLRGPACWQPLFCQNRSSHRHCEGKKIVEYIIFFFNEWINISTAISLHIKWFSVPCSTRHILDLISLECSLCKQRFKTSSENDIDSSATLHRHVSGFNMWRSFVQVVFQPYWYMNICNTARDKAVHVCLQLTSLYNTYITS